jgi:hypothetical protein
LPGPVELGNVGRGIRPHMELVLDDVFQDGPDPDREES